MSAVRCLEVTEKHKWYTFLTPCLDFTIILKSLTTVNEMLSINPDNLGIWKSVDITSEKNINVRASIYHLSKKKDKKPQVAVVWQTAHKLNELICHPQLCQHSLGWWHQLSSAFGGLRQSHEVAWRPQLMLESPWCSTEMLAWLNLFSCSYNYSASSSHQAFNMGLLHMVYISRVDRLASWRVAAATAAKSLQSCPTLCDRIDGSPLGSPVPGILQTRTLEWVTISFSSAWKWKVKVKLLSHVWLLATSWTAAYQAPLPMGFSRQEYWSGVPLPSPMEG